MASSKLDLDVFFVLFSIGRVDFGVFYTSKVIERVSWGFLSFSQRTFHVIIELSCEIIAVVYSEKSFVERNVLAESEVLPNVVFRKLPNHFWNFLSLQEDTLGDS